MNQNLLVLTVGTGTAGASSNLAQGLINTIAQLQPRRFWLMPSSSPDSLAVAELIREAGVHGFAAWTEGAPYRLIENPDQLGDCRAAVRELIRQVRRELKPGERLLVNPTSGTKQMSAGATLAALDEQVGDIVFTVGQRRDGVVITGTERIAGFDAGEYFAERDLNLARDLFAAGSWLAAARVLEPHPQFLKERALGLCLTEWSCLNYAKAAAHASRFSEPLRSHLSALAQWVKNSQLDALVLADLLDNASASLRASDFGAALAMGYKALEYAARLRLFTTAQISPPYHFDAISALPLSGAVREQLRATTYDDGCIRPGLSQVIDILASCKDPFAADYRSNHALKKLLGFRNQLTHEIRPVAQEEATALITRVRDLVGAHMPTPQVPARPVTL